MQMNCPYKIELDKLLSNEIAVLQNLTETSFNNAENKIKANGIILFGSGIFSLKIVKGLRSIGIEPIGFCDNDEKKWGNTKENLKIFSPKEAVSKFPNAIYMVTIWNDIIGHPIDEIKEKLNSYGKVEVISFFYLFWKYQNLFLPYFSIDLPIKSLLEKNQILECFDLFTDDDSKREYVAQIKWRLTGDYTGLGDPSKFTQYFPLDLFKLNENEVFVDCGAFDGDTLKNFIQIQKTTFKKYYAFEPDPINFDKMKRYVSELPNNLSSKISTEQFGVSDTKKQITFSSNGSLQSSYSESGNIVVNCISIDEFFENIPVTYIKMDTEGAEPEIIEGSIKTILNHQPIFAISVYHTYNHLWTLPLMMKKISKNYSFFLRPHCKASWDLICYAVPKNRLINSK